MIVMDNLANVQDEERQSTSVASVLLEDDVDSQYLGLTITGSASLL